MKLLNRTSYTYLILAFPIISITMVLFYFLIRNFNLQHVENNLKLEHNKLIKKSENIENYYIEDELSDELLVFEIPKDSIIKDTYSTINIFDKLENQYEPFQQLETMQEIAGKNYRILIRKSLVENSTLVYSISIAVFVLIMVMAGSFIFLNRILSDRVWHPFREILSNLSNYRVGGEYKSLEKSKIDEFKDLDASIQSMVQRINKEYFVQKEFIDIVSHEYQTPLAVVSNEAELLLQSKNLREEEAKKIYRIISYVQKLSKMNQALLLLSRIDNNQYNETSIVNLKTVFDQLLVEKQYQIELKSIEIKIIEHENCYFQINPILASILIGNLLQNAIRHNHKKNGTILIELTKHQMIVANTSDENQLDESIIFMKFTKSETSKNSIGLGLNIVEAICNHYDFRLKYHYNSTERLHAFIVKLKS